MIVRALHTDVITAGTRSIFDVLDTSLAGLKERSVLVVTSKIVSLCEGRTLPLIGTDLPATVEAEAEYFMPEAETQHGYTFTMAHNMLTPNSGIDESNAGGVYVLWPKDPQASANAIRQYLVERFKLQEVAVVIADSTFLPLRWGAVGMGLAYSGINPVRSYSDQTDLFGRPLKLTRTNVTDSLATAAVFVMGEGAEQTPLAVVSELPEVQFVPRDPSAEEIAARVAPPSEDSFGPLLTAVNWQPGGRA